MQQQADILGKNIEVRERDTCWGVARGVLVAFSLAPNAFKDQKSTLYSPNI